MSSAEELLYRKREILVEQLSRIKAEESLHEFTKQAWHVLKPRTPFVDGWHIQAVCEHLEAVTLGEIRFLIINVPPRTCKSTIVSVMWPCWMWAKSPSYQFLCAANSHGISIRDSLMSRDLIDSDWYQARWGNKVQIMRYGAEKFENTEKGFRQATSVGSKVTGKGGDFLIADDLNDTKQVMSDTVRDSTNVWFSSAFSTRLNNIKTGGIVVMMQRCHEMDVTGYILKNELGRNAVKLILPMKYELKRKCVTVPLKNTGGKPWEDPRSKEGQLLWPEQFGEAECKWREDALDSSYAIAGQEQQRPAPEEGGLFKAKHFQKWKKAAPPKLRYSIQSWDTALESSEMSDYSVATTWGIFDDDNGVPNIILVSLFRERLEYPDLRRRAKKLYDDWRDTADAKGIVANGKNVPDIVLIEKKGSGHVLIQDLRRAGVPVFEYIPEKDKVYRANMITPLIECGRVWLPCKEPHFEEFLPPAQILIDECIVFPYGANDDIVDSMTQALSRIRDSGLLRVKGDPVFTRERKRQMDFYGPGGN